MATELAPVTPSVLRWARETVDVPVEVAAKRAGVTPERIESWEAGEAEPTLAKLKALAKLYQRPLSLFFLPSPPTTFQPIQDFRRLPGSADHSWSRALHKVYRRAVEQQDVARELSPDGPGRVEVPPATLAMDPGTAAATARSALGVTLEDQFSWRKPDDVFDGWLAATEQLGVLVLRTSEVSNTEMRGFSLGGGSWPAIVVNAMDWPRGQTFTLLHELAHLMLRESAVCNLLEPATGHEHDVEVWCNAVAAAILMPAGPFLDNDVLAGAGVQEWDDEVLAQLSHRWGASREAVARRLVTLGRATPEFYERKRADAAAAYEELRRLERDRRRGRETGGGPPPYRMVIRDRGRPYVNLVLDAYNDDELSPSSLSNVLGMKLRHLTALESELRR